MSESMSTTEDNQVYVSEDSAVFLLQLLLRRGYLSSRPEDQQSDHPQKEHPHDDDSMEAMQRWTRMQEDQERSSMSKDLLLITTDGRFGNVDTMMRLWIEALERKGYRMTVEEVCETLFLTEEQLLDQVYPFGKECLQLVSSKSVVILTPHYYDQIAVPLILQHNGLEQKGCLSVSDVAHKVLNLPSDMVLQELKQRVESCLSSNHVQLLQMHGGMWLVTDAFMSKLRQELRTVFSTIEEPTPLATVCRGNRESEWDIDLVSKLVQELLDDKQLAGELHHERSSNADSTLYVPSLFETKQRELAENFFTSHGYITTEQCRQYRIPVSKLGSFMLQSVPDALVLRECVIHPHQAVVTQLVSGIQSMVSEASFLDLRLVLPEGILRDEDDVRKLVSEIATRTSAQSSLLLISGDDYLLFSNEMISDVKTRNLSSLVEMFGKQRATELSEKQKSTEETEDGEGQGVRKGKKSSTKSKRKVKKHSATSTLQMTSSFGVVPLRVVAAQVATNYPDLLDIQSSYGPLLEEGYDGDWEADGDDGPLYDFCRQALYTDEMKASCVRAVQAELDRIQKQSAAMVSSRKEGAARSRMIEAAFSSAFTTACYRLQAHQKYLDFLGTANGDVALTDDTMNTLQQEFATGYCSDFARRVTEFCLFKNDLESGVFDFVVSGCEGQELDKEDDSLPYFARPVDGARRRPLSTTKLYCVKDANISSEHLQDSLATLRVVMAGGIGVTLARMWTYCGSECFTSTIDFVRPCSIESFLSHVEEHCLTLCGLPYKRLDKKTQKQFLFARRQELTKRLEATNTDSMEEILELTVMLLFQQIRGLAVSGSFLTGPILDLLCEEKKISEEVTKLLKDASNVLQTPSSTDIMDTNSLFSKVKACGLCRDITKLSFDDDLS